MTDSQLMAIRATLVAALHQVDALLDEAGSSRIHPATTEETQLVTMGQYDEEDDEPS